MSQGVEYWEVDRRTWGDKRRLDTVISCHGTRDRSLETLETATVELDGEPLGETIVRCYLVTVQGRRERTPIGTWLAQGSRRKTDGLATTLSENCHSTLMPLHNRNQTGGKCPVGYTVPAGVNCADMAEQILRTRGIAPVVASKSDATLEEPWTAGTQTSWLEVAKAMAESASMEIGVDVWGRVTLGPSQAGSYLQPRWTFADDGNSILLPDAEEEMDLYDVPNVCEAVWSQGGKTVVGRAVNDSPDSPVSTVNRGYENILRLENPEELQSGCTQASADIVALKHLREQSIVSRTITISHGWCDATAGDPVRVEYASAGMFGTGRIESMDFDVGVGMTATSKVSVNQEVWRG